MLGLCGLKKALHLMRSEPKGIVFHMMWQLWIAHMMIVISRWSCKPARVQIVNTLAKAAFIGDFARLA
jgi:hypothetical protein